MCSKGGRACHIGGVLQQRLQRRCVCEQRRIAVVEVKQGVRAGGVGHHSIQEASMFLSALS